MLRMDGSTDEGELTAPFLLRRPIPYSPPAHVCTPERLEWAARV